MSQQCGMDGRMLISLRAAYEQFRREPGCSCNSYDWYRQRAQREGIVDFGNRRQLVPARRPGMPVAKVKGQWMVDQEDVDAELAEHQASRAELEHITADYHNRVLHGGPGGRPSERASAATRSIATSTPFGALTPNLGRTRVCTGSAAGAGSRRHSLMTSRSATRVRIGGAAAGTAP